MALKGTGKVFDGLKAGGKRWLILLLLFFSTVNNYLDRHVLSVLAVYMMANLGISEMEYSWVTNAFRVGGILGLFFAGPFVDKYGSRLGFALAVIFWSIGGAMTGLAIGLISLMVFRFILGLGESANWPASSKAVSEWFPAKERGLAMGFFNGGVSIGAILAPWFVAAFVWLASLFASPGTVTDNQMDPAWMWRLPFVLAALVGVPWIYYWLKIYYQPEKHPTVSREELELIQADKVKAAPKKTTAVLKKPHFWGLFFARGITSPLWFFITEWLYIYLSQEFGFGLGKMAAFAWIPFVATDIGNILGGYFSGKLVAHGLSPIQSRITLMGIGAILMGVSCFFVRGAATPFYALTMISLMIFFWGIWVSNMLAIAADSFPSREVGSVISWTGLAQYGGAFIYTFFIGYWVENFGFGIVFMITALLPIVGFLFTLALSREKIVEKANA
jgi:ACS family hexuronate transporter-like MFS transporter